MAKEESTEPERPARKQKRAVEPVEEPAPSLAPTPALPTSSQVRKAKKADLVAWAKQLDLDGEGKVDALRSRILAELGKREAPREEPEAQEGAPKGKPAKKLKGREGAEEAEEDEEEEHVARLKPELSASLVRALQIRRAISAKRPRFLAQEWFRHKRLGLEWRKPQGGQSKLRRHFIQRINVVSIGYRGPKISRGLHPSGFEEVLVHSTRDLRGINPKRQAARIGGAVGARKREMIQKEADELGIRVLNRREE